MKKFLIVLIFLITSKISLACSCDYGGNFIYSSYHSQIVVKGQVINMFYNFADGTRINSENKKEFNDYLINTGQQFFESIQVEIIELIKGVEKRKIIEIFSGDGADCRAEVLSFPIGKVFIFSLNYTTDSYTDMPNEKDDDFILRGCFESSIEFIQEKNQVRGIIKGKSYRKRVRNYPYDKLIEKIS